MHPVRHFWQRWEILEADDYAEDDVEQLHPSEPGGHLDNLAFNSSNETPNNFVDEEDGVVEG